jgi:hypothetical protein
MYDQVFLEHVLTGYLLTSRPNALRYLRPLAKAPNVVTFADEYRSAFGAVVFERALDDMRGESCTACSSLPGLT